MISSSSFPYSCLHSCIQHIRRLRHREVKIHITIIGQASSQATIHRQICLCVLIPTFSFRDPKLRASTEPSLCKSHSRKELFRLRKSVCHASVKLRRTARGLFATLTTFAISKLALFFTEAFLVHLVILNFDRSVSGR